MALHAGLYEELLNERLQRALKAHPELRTIFGRLDPEEEPSRYAAFIARVLEQALSQTSDGAARLKACNEIIA